MERLKCLHFQQRSRLHLKGQAPLQIPKKLFIQHKFVTGQAILELAIFGALLIMLLGILVNYGLRYIYQQQAMQQTFRSALASATVSMNQNTPTSTSHTLVEDKYLPDPNNPFGAGSVIPVSSSANVIRSFKLQETPDNEQELPVVAINIGGKEYLFKTAGIRTEEIDRGSLARYQEIYGYGNVWEVGAAAASSPTIKVKIIDSSAGEIMDYESAVSQSRKIVDSAACTTQCARGGGANCAATCGQPMNVPSYAQGYQEIDAAHHQYVFPVLEEQRNMGIQSGSTQTTSTSGSLTKTETPSGTSTTEQTDWQIGTTRTIVSRSATGELESREVETTVSEDTTRKW